MTNKDFSYLDDVLAKCICFVYDRTVHPKSVGEKRISFIREQVKDLSLEEKEYLRNSIRAYFEEMRCMRERNQRKK